VVRSAHHGGVSGIVPIFVLSYVSVEMLVLHGSV